MRVEHPIPVLVVSNDIHRYESSPKVIEVQTRNSRNASVIYSGLILTAVQLEGKGKGRGRNARITAANRNNPTLTCMPMTANIAMKMNESEEAENANGTAWKRIGQSTERKLGRAVGKTTADLPWQCASILGPTRSK
jgi:hypothetical protein